MLITVDNINYGKISESKHNDNDDYNEDENDQ